MLPILLSLGPIKIYSYGLFVALAFIVATFLIWKLSREEEIEEEKILDLILVTIFFAIIGARIFYILFHQEEFSPDLIRTIHLTKFPGLVFYGGLIFGTTAAIIFILKNKLPFWQASDICVLGLSLGQGIGRLGCFLNGCCYGKVTKLPWGVYFPGLLGKRQPTQIYEALTDFLIFFFLFKIYQKTQLSKREKRGYVFLSYFIFSNLSRFTLEFLRDNSVYWQGLSVAQIISAVLTLIAIIIFIIKYREEIKQWIINISLKLKSKRAKLKS